MCKRALLVSLVLTAAACGNSDDLVSLTVTLAPLASSSVKGSVVVKQLAEGGVRLEGQITGLVLGKHGFHVHEKPDCSAPDGTSAGGHFNPSTGSHGAVELPDSHLGDLGNIEANNAGIAKVSVTKNSARLVANDTSSYLDRAIIVDANPDDYTTQPTGNTGPRLACGVIKADS